MLFNFTEEEVGLLNSRRNLVLICECASILYAHKRKSMQTYRKVKLAIQPSAREKGANFELLRNSLQGQSLQGPL
jgi:hypothetical protein